LRKPISQSPETLQFWLQTLVSVSVNTVSSPKAEVFYWVTIMFSQTLGTALGDWTSDTEGFGYAGAALLFGGLLAVVAVAYYRARISRTFLFWAAFILIVLLISRPRAARMAH